jgi:hypothetical protein
MSPHRSGNPLWVLLIVVEVREVSKTQDSVQWRYWQRSGVQQLQKLRGRSLCVRQSEYLPVP